MASLSKDTSGAILSFDWKLKSCKRNSDWNLVGVNIIDGHPVKVAYIDPQESNIDTTESE